jgi:hypothetical protein
MEVRWKVMKNCSENIASFVISVVETELQFHVQHTEQLFMEGNCGYLLAMMEMLD